MDVRRPRYFIPLICLLGLLAGVLVAEPWSGPKGAQLAFQRVAYNDFGSSHYESRAAGLVVIASDGDLKTHQNLLSLAGAAAVPATDYGRFITVIVFNGLRPSSNYGIEVGLVRATADSVAILATTVEPRPRTIVAPEATSPYEVITIPRPPGMRGPVTFRLFLNGRRWAVFEVVKRIE